ncbi:hypothetical protein [Actinoplanes sp. OR16]|uniref:hypothetical protein n=1 Tax=Actinoplanes sp. OR16 TaxID=946334 RepID=UPI000FDCD325|nr:hypothetical protein [Actinoplanes sp. OR16]
MINSWTASQVNPVLITPSEMMFASPSCIGNNSPLQYSTRPKSETVLQLARAVRMRKLQVSSLSGHVLQRRGQPLIDTGDFIHGCFYDLAATSSSRSSEVQLF